MILAMILMKYLKNIPIEITVVVSAMLTVDIIDKLNNWPRKSFNYVEPNDIFNTN